jgi:hypothetical protein
MMEKAITSFEKGLVIVNDPITQPEHSYPFALNAIKDSPLINPGVLSNEKGFSRYLNLLANGDIVLGYQSLEDNSFVIFLYNEASSPKSKICLITPSTTTTNGGVISTVYSNNDLAFNKLYSIKSTYKLNLKRERIVYFITDGSPIRSINVDDASLYSANLGSLYPEYSTPIISPAVNDLGGALKTGAYQFFIAYKQNEIATSFTGLTKSTYILKAPQSITSKPNEEKGGSESEIPTSKSITLSFSDLDTAYSKFDLGVVVTLNSTSTPYIIKSNVPFTSSTYEYIYSGTESLIDIADINDILVDTVIIKSAEVIAQKDNRLLLGNVTYQDIVLNYQSYANNIRVNWYDSETFSGCTDSLNLRAGNSLTDKYDTADKAVVRQMTTSFNADVPMSFMRDEVYALGIQFELKSGGYTPVYHIPGRAVDTRYTGNAFVGVEDNPEIVDNFTTWDSQLSTITGHTTEKRWEVFNTASSQGDLAYYESEEVYPDGYGFPTTGSSVTGPGTTKVRHHKMPDNRITQIYTTVTTTSGGYETYTNTRKYLGLNFSNIEIPTEILGVINGFRIMIVPRDTPSNKSILAKGLFQNIIKSTSEGDLYGHTPKRYNWYDTVGSDDDDDLTGDNSDTPSRENRLKAFYSPDTLFESPTLSVSKVSTEFIQAGNPYYIYGNPTDSTVLENASICILNQHESISRTYGNLQSEVDEALYIGHSANISDLGNISLIDRFYNVDRQPLVLIQTAENISNSADQADVNIVANLSNGNKTYFLYGSIKRNNLNQYGDILRLTYTPTTLYVKDLTVDGDNLITGTVNGLIGDTYIELFTKRITHSKYKDYMANPPEYFAGVIGFFVETSLNIRYRVVGTDLQNTPFPQGIYTSTGEAYNYLETTFPFAEQFTLNQDFNLEFTNKTYEAYSTKLVDLGRNLNYPTRLLYSELDLSESIIDYYRVFKANNYRDLPKNKGKLTALFTKEEILYGTTLDSLWMFQTSQQQLETNSSTIVIGTGEFLAIEPRELVNTQSGYLGVKDNLCVSQSPYGTLLVDQERGNIFLFTGKVQDITLQGIQSWFFENKDLSLARYGFTNINPHNPNSIGYLTSYDVEKARFLITKRDYDLITPALFKGTVDDVDSLVESSNLFVGDILLEPSTQVFKKVTNLTPVTLVTVVLSDTTIFYNKGFTISYNALAQSFVSLHSYIPTNYFEVKARLFSRDVTQGTTTEQGIYRHNTGIYGRYYTANIKPFILEATLSGNNVYTKVFDSFIVGSYSTASDSTYNSKVIYDLCFDKVILSNDMQCSGEVTLGETDIKRAERVWRFNNFKDLSVNSTEPVWLTNKSLLQDDYYIDKILNTNRLDVNKPWYEKARMRDKYINARFILNNLENKNFLCTFVSSNYRVSHR